MNIFVFDIETIPDTQSGSRLYNLTDLTDKEIAENMFERRRQETNGSDFLRLHLHRIVTISVVLRTSNQLKVWSLGDANSSEKELLERFFAGIEKYSPTLVSWNGSGFDLPVLHYRALLHGVSAPRYWETGEYEQSFKWNNYLSRYHYRHTDLMDVLAGYQARANAPLNEIAVMLGLPGKMGIDGSHVWDYFQRGEIETIRNYCETDVLNTYLVFLRFELIRGKLSEQEYQAECELLRTVLEKENKSHFNEFLHAWNK
jgi:predicted PolB exonuclease-like 3'-5' exonuclease